jgi:dUTP pyrophosphatase
MTKVEIINETKHELPKYATEGSAGMDLRANLETSIILKPLERTLVPTGIKIKLPAGAEAQIRPRSGLAFKNGVTVLNSPGTIDSDYVGEVKVLLVNLSNQDFTINDGERVAQMIISKYETVQWDVVTELAVTERGASGFGHTGTK